MAGPAPILRELGRIRRHLKELESKLEHGPRLLKAQQTKLAQQESAMHEAQEKLKQMKVRIHEKEVTVKATQTQTKKYESQRNEAKSKKEYDTFGAEIAHSNGIVLKLEDELLEMMGEVEEETKKLPEVEKIVLKAKADFAQFERDHKERLQLYAAERTRALEELQTTEASLPIDTKEMYGRLIKAKGADALAGVGGQTCSACYTDITPQMFTELNQEQFVLCKNCGRILYLDK